jgi:hypothetical protein
MYTQVCDNLRCLAWAKPCFDWIIKKVQKKNVNMYVSRVNKKCRPMKRTKSSGLNPFNKKQKAFLQIVNKNNAGHCVVVRWNGSPWLQ